MACLVALHQASLFEQPAQQQQLLSLQVLDLLKCQQVGKPHADKQAGEVSTFLNECMPSKTKSGGKVPV